ncbi:hypothetical protein J437_LFUL010917 [Ladona fulva]|uniref:Uncharacterized protein n=1 Tax=Ladona fulva TaxID=123851 RepID=A0A8K0KAY1_LADFU|nr:hypothetical protein J437_LFUL010917 [Ladona fulva]
MAPCFQPKNVNHVYHNPILIVTCGKTIFIPWLYLSSWRGPVKYTFSKTCAPLECISRNSFRELVVFKTRGRVHTSVEVHHVNTAYKQHQQFMAVHKAASTVHRRRLE